MIISSMGLAIGINTPTFALEDTKPITQVVLLGTGTPQPHHDRHGPATAIIVNGNSYIFDAGDGVVRQAGRAAKKYGIDALKAGNLSRVFLTHLHWDHTIGLSDIQMTPWTLGRKGPLKLFGPKGTVAMGNNIVEAFERDIYTRVYGMEPTNDIAWRVEPTEFENSYTYRDDNVTIEAFRVCHGDWDYAVGYKVTTPDKTIVISGDTTYCPIIEEKAQGVDILIHEVYSEKSLMKDQTPEWQTYHKAFHTSAEDLAKIANKAKPKLLVLYHQITWGNTPREDALNELKGFYKGKIHDGRDLDVIKIPD
jgi:ribonuclease BN (tRNA processing enzyme)